MTERTIDRGKLAWLAISGSQDLPRFVNDRGVRLEWKSPAFVPVGKPTGLEPKVIDAPATPIPRLRLISYSA